MTETTLPLSPTAEDFNVLMDRMAERHGFAQLDAGNFEAFAAGPGDRVVLFAEDPVRVPETWDVAVVLPEVLKRLGGSLQAGVLDVASARGLALRYGFSTWPALVFLRAGEYVGAIEGMRDWDAYLREMSAMLDRPAGRAPSLGIAVRTPGVLPRAGSCQPSGRNEGAPGACH
jgi:hydrogenase-1 operon protein HyaE